ncbi:L,D-transpeptidase family protein [Nitrincola tapanii]|uniref:Murein L,D-transpeptidase n=1 Tax=Nitrincola tapanii TaxID=1708751 RepID=A0A5A9W3S3_9GAMM|nr:L,D-transpeptidase family protein [Nitrincola tapanii]KAA0875420.1 murein L,D-transpeptidase [Nitrincola tapanii]
MYKKRSIHLLCVTAVLSWPFPLMATEVPEDLLHLPETAVLQSPAQVQRFYTLAQHKLVWQSAERYQQLLDELQALADDGLNPDAYGLDRLYNYLELESDDPSWWQERDLLATQAYLQALKDLMFGRLNPAQVEPIWQQETPLQRPDSDAQNLFALQGLDRLQDTFTQARPSDPRYHHLRQAYAHLRQQDQSALWQEIPAGPLLRPGQADARVQAVRNRLLPELQTDTPDLYDSALSDAVRQFQQAHALNADAIIGPATLQALNSSPTDRLNQIRINLERFRWLAREMEAHMVLVDIAGAQVSYWHDGQIVWQGRAQVGRAERPTPILKSQITHFTFNPTWTVPPTILRRDKLPEIRRDLGYLQRHRMRVLNFQGQELDPNEVDWWNPGGIMLRQDAGPGNALGQVAIRFPNPHAVYLHDTPSQRLFEQEQRAFSSGCVRVEKALDLVAELIEWNRIPGDQPMNRLLEDGRTRNVNLVRNVPVLLAYWTAEADAQGRVSYRPDVYQMDATLLRALENSLGQGIKPPSLH